MTVNERQLCDGVTPQLLEVGSIVAIVNVMRYGASTTNVVLRTRQDIRPAFDECLSPRTLISCLVVRQSID